MRDSTATLATENSLIPPADNPALAETKAATATTFDLGVLAPSTTDAPVAAVPSTIAKPTATTALRSFAIVHLNNSTAAPVKVVIDDAEKRAAVLGAGEAVDWVVKTSATKGESGSARVNGTNCGPAWQNVNNVVGGREYHLEIKPSAGVCAGGQAMPKIVLTDYTNGTSRTLIGPIPDASHALVYIVNKYDAPAKVTITDVETVEWTIDPTVWGAPQMLTTAVDHGDGVNVTRTDEACGDGDSDDYFIGGRTYRVEVVAGLGNCSGVDAPGLAIHDLTAQTSRLVGA